MKKDSTKLISGCGSSCAMGIIGMFIGGFIGASTGWDIGSQKYRAGDSILAVIDAAGGLLVGAVAGLIIGLVLNLILILFLRRKKN